MNSSPAPIAIRIVARSGTAGADAPSSSSSPSVAPRWRGQRRSMANATQITGRATRARPNPAPRPSARPVPMGPARSVHRPRATSTPRTIRPTANASARWPASWAPAASLVRASAVGSVRDERLPFDPRRDRRGGPALALLLALRERERGGSLAPRRGRWHPPTVTLPTPAPTAIQWHDSQNRHERPASRRQRRQRRRWSHRPSMPR